MQFVDRAGWGARAPKGQWTSWPAGQPSGVAVHWEGAGGQPDHANCAAEVRSIQNFHMGGDYIDIAYNAAVCQHGVVFEGRPVGYRSAAQNAANSTHVAICFLGGPSTPFTAAAKQAVNNWISEIVPASARGLVQGHRETPGNSTACPGGEILDWVHQGRPVDGQVPAAPFVPPPAAAPSTKPVLRQGAHGPAVMELQRKLNAVGGAGLAVDGAFGPRTSQAVKNFQGFFKLGVDGVVGPQTWGMLDFCAAQHGIR